MKRVPLPNAKSLRRAGFFGELGSKLNGCPFVGTYTPPRRKNNDNKERRRHNENR